MNGLVEITDMENKKLQFLAQDGDLMGKSEAPICFMKCMAPAVDEWMDNQREEDRPLQVYNPISEKVCGRHPHKVR